MVKNKEYGGIKMGVLWNREAPEKKVYSAYGMTVYGKVNTYQWNIFAGNPVEKCLISLRIVRESTTESQEILNISMGNNVILERVFERTIDNFLYWIVKEFPFDNMIEEMAFRALTRFDTLFNSRIEKIKWKEKETKRRLKEYGYY